MTPYPGQPPSAQDNQVQKNVRVVYPNVLSSDTQAQPASRIETGIPKTTVSPPPPPAPGAVSDNTQPAPPSATPPQPTQIAHPDTQPAVQSSKASFVEPQQQTQVGHTIASVKSRR